LMYEERILRRFPLSPAALSYWTLDEQVRAMGPTRLDQVLAGYAAPPAGAGDFVREFDAALEQRRQVLLERGLLGEGETLLSFSAVRRMRASELRSTAEQLSAEIGKPVDPSPPGSVRGVYTQRIDLAQGRMALIVGERRASLISWRPSLERLAGREIEGGAPEQGLSW